MRRVNINKIKFLHKEYKGSYPKQWVLFGEPFLVKLNNILVHPNQDVREYIASNILKTININTVDVILITMYDKKGCMVKTFLEKEETINSFFTGVYKDIIRDYIILQKNEEINEQLERAFNYVFITFNEVANNPEYLYGRDSLETDYIKMVFGDCIIANEDRAFHNFGVITNPKTKSVRLTPSFDNASSFTTKNKDMLRIANELFNRFDVMDYLINNYAHVVKEHYDLFIENYDQIVYQTKKLKDEIGEEEVEYMLDSLKKTKKHLLTHDLKNQKTLVRKM